MSCPGCGGAFRKGTTVLLLGEAGAERKRVCPKCAGAGLTVVAVKQPTIVKQNVFTGGASYNADVIRTLTTYAKLARLGARPGEPMQEFQAGRAEGFEGAIELLKGRK